MRTLILVLLIVTTAAAPSAPSARADRVELIDGTTIERRVIESITPADGVTFARTDRAVPWASVRRIDRVVSAQPAPLRAARLFLTDGSVLFAQQLTIDDEGVTFDSVLRERVRWPLADVRGITLRPLSVDAHGRAQPEAAFAEALALDRPTEDRLFVITEDKLTAVAGALARLADDHAAFVWSGDERRVDRGKIYGLTFARTGDASADHTDMTRVTFVDGSTLWVDAAGLEGGQLTLQRADGVEFTVPLDRVASLEHRSRRLVFLSDLEPTSTEVDAIATYPWPPRMDAAVTGSPLRLGETRYDRGIGMHAPTRMTWHIDGAYQTLIATIGLDAAADQGGDCVFKVMADGAQRYDRRMRHGDAPVECRVDLAGVRMLTLIVEAGANLDIADHADWADARLIRAAE